MRRHLPAQQSAHVPALRYDRGAGRDEQESGRANVRRRTRSRGARTDPAVARWREGDVLPHRRADAGASRSRAAAHRGGGRDREPHHASRPAGVQTAVVRASEIEQTDALIRAAGWRGPILFRAPYNKKLVYLPWYLARHDRIHVTFDVEPESDKNIDGHTDRIIADVLTHTRPGSIILLHPWYANRGATRAAIRPIVDGLRARGFQLVTVSELLMERGRPRPK